MNTYVKVWEYLAEFFLEWEKFLTKDIEKVKIHILFWIICFPENRDKFEIM